MVVQWLRLNVCTAGGTGLIPAWGTKMPPHAAHHSQKKERGGEEKEGNSESARVRGGKEWSRHKAHTTREAATCRVDNGLCL